MPQKKPAPAPQKKKDEKPAKDAKPKTPIIKLKEETRHGIYAVICFVLALVFILGAFHMAGPAGDSFYSLFNQLLGIGYILVPVALAMLGASFVKSVKPDIGLTHTLTSLLFLSSGLAIIDIATMSRGGGALGKIVAALFIKMFAVYGSILILGALFIISIFVMFDERPNLMPIMRDIAAWFKGKFNKEKPEEYEYDEYKEDDEEYEEDDAERVEEEKPEIEEKKEEVKSDKKDKKEKKEEEEFSPSGYTFKSNDEDYVPPPLTLLEEDKGKPNVGDIKSNANIIKRTLQNFGILVEMDEITIGPSITRYALKPAEGVKLSRIVGLQNDLALALAAHPIRIEAPIPGKSLVGIEIPNKTKATVGLAGLLRDEKLTSSPKNLMIPLGKNITGKAQLVDLAKTPHSLIAGTTGSGKSVTIHSIVTSLLYRNGPGALRFIMVDPKRVELTLYNRIPHLLTPVITDAKKAILALKWAAKEMDRRYDILEAESVRDIESYHNNILKDKKKGGDDKVEAMPYIVIIIDELADIMQAYPRELESAIVRLAQMSRAVGIHLILSTQRPEVAVITGLIKANVPTRVALKVASQLDSRTILDDGGAEKLLGQGDMLYSFNGKKERLQSAFISENEVKNIVKFLVENCKYDIPQDEIVLAGDNITSDKTIFSSEIDDGDEDEMYEAARETVIEAGKASTSYLQRKLKLGYARAARLMDMLEDRGVIGPGDGAKPREVLEKGVSDESEEFGRVEEENV